MNAISDFTDYEVLPGGTMLPTYKGYVVDVRLREFRKVEHGKLPEFISFRSSEGDELLVELIRLLPQEHRLWREIAATI